MENCINHLRPVKFPLAGVWPVWDFGGLTSALCIRDGLGAATCALEHRGGLGKPSLCFNPSVRFYFDAADLWVFRAEWVESHQWTPSQASAQPHKHLILIKFSMSCVFICTGALFWVYLVCLMPLGSSALFFPSQLFGVHTFPISIPPETASTLEEVFLGDITDKVQLKYDHNSFLLFKTSMISNLMRRNSISLLYLRYNPTPPT